jgi:O-antigen/teichoic acid export membrane protein
VGLNIKNYFKISAIYTALAAFPAVLQLFIQPFIEGNNRLGTTDFSAIAIIESISVVATLIVIFQLNASLVRFYYDKEEDSGDFKTLISSTFSAILLNGIILLVLVYLFEKQIGLLFSQPYLKDFGKYGYAAIIVGITRSVNLTAAALYRNQKDVSSFVKLSLAMGLVRIGFQLGFLFFYDMSFLGYIYGSCIGGSIVMLFVILRLIKNVGISFDIRTLVPLYQYAFPLFLFSIMHWLMNYMDRYFLESNATDLAIYDTAMKFAIGLEVVFIGISNAAKPELFSLMSKGIKENEQEIKQLSNIQLIQILIITIFAILPVMGFIYYFFETDIRFAFAIVPVVFIRYIQKAQYTTFSSPLYYEKKTGSLFWINAISLVMCFGLNYYLIPLYGYYGAIIAILISQFFQVEATHFIQQKFIQISWNLKKLKLFPYIILMVTIITEWYRIQADYSAIYTAFIFIFISMISLFFMYNSEIKKLGIKYGLLK